MFNEEIKASISNCVLSWLATANKDGIPNVSPKEIFTSFGSRTILIANIASPQSVKNIKHNPQACLSFIDIFVQKGFQIKGKAEIISKKDANFESFHAPLFEIAGPSFPFASIIKIEAEHIKPIIAPRYRLFPETTEEEQIESALKTYNVKR